MPGTNHKPQRIDVTAQQVAKVYAKALLAAAEKAGATDEVVEQFAAIARDVLVKKPELEGVLSSGLIDHQAKLGILDRLFQGRVHQLLLNFFKVLSQHGRLNLLRAVQIALAEAYDELRGRVAVEVRTAQPLSPQTIDFITAQVRGQLGGQPRLEIREEPSLIAGVVLRVGDKVYDGSVATQLRAVRQEMISRTDHEIQSRRDRFRH